MAFTNSAVWRAGYRVPLRHRARTKRGQVHLCREAGPWPVIWPMLDSGIRRDRNDSNRVEGHDIL
jgi:hypothetical protein